VPEMITVAYPKANQSLSSFVPQKNKRSSVGGYLNKTFEERQRIWKEKQKTDEESTALTMLNEEQEECTFAPKIVSRPKSAQSIKRCFSQFLVEQGHFLESKAERLEAALGRLITEERKNLKDLPSINRNTSNFLDIRDRSKESIYSRLYSVEKENQTSIISSVQNWTKSIYDVSKADEYFKSKITREITKIYMRFVQDMESSLTFDIFCIFTMSTLIKS
jgi:hypothetical protein